LTRTTNALEAYNGVLGKKISKKGHFFKFVKILLDEEFASSREFQQLVDSGGSSAIAQKLKYKVKLILKTDSKN
jgi:hypothetical protein